MKHRKVKGWAILDALKHPEFTESVMQRYQVPQFFEEDKQRIEGNVVYVEYLGRSLISMWEEMRGMKITALSQTFTDALDKSPIKFEVNDIISSFGGQTLEGCVIYGSAFIIFYKLHIREDLDEDLPYIESGFIRIFNKVGGIYAFIDFGMSGNKQLGFCSDFIRNIVPDATSHEQALNNFSSVLIKLHFFKEFAPIETKIVNRNSKIFNPKTSRVAFENNSNQDVEYLDCTWFTTIIRNEPFGVRGHFRLQPYKNENGEWTKKFIYIKPFQKSGIIRKAKKLNN